MTFRHFITIFCLCLCFAIGGLAQETGRFSGGFQSQANFFLRDSLIGAAGIPQYDRQLFGAQGWLDLKYSVNGFDMGLRFDLFNNSNLRNPNFSFTDQGIGRWFISKQIDKFSFTVGHIYDQIGSGIIYRAFEERPLFIDNALYGARVAYDFNDDWQAKAFTGRQKLVFDAYESIIKGAAIEGFHNFEAAGVSIVPGIGVVNRTLDDQTMESIVGILTGYIDSERVKPVHNVYVGSIFNTLNAGKFVWYVESGVKSSDVFNDPTAQREVFGGSTVTGSFVKKPGSVIYSSLSYAAKGLGITVEGKRTEAFNLRTDPTLLLNNGIINFLPPMNRQNTYRLTTRYSPATQDLSELAFQGDIRYSFNRKTSILFNASNITDLDGELLYREFFTEFNYKYKRDWQIKTGFQIQNYNQAVYEVKPEVPLVETFVPYVDFLYRITRKKSLRTEIQYMKVGPDGDTKQDYGDWLFAQLEYNIVPGWSFVASDMFNTAPGKNSPIDQETGEKLSLHYPRFDVFYTHESNRFGLSYVKQVEGVVCTGGICRLEPAFSGVQFTINSTF